MKMKRLRRSYGSTLTAVDPTTALLSHPWLMDLDEDILHDVLHFAVLVQKEVDDVLVQYNTDAEGLIFITNGLVKVSFIKSCACKFCVAIYI